jgi:hypothetical protein
LPISPRKSDFSSSNMWEPVCRQSSAAGRDFSLVRIPVDRDRAFRFNVTEDSEFA